MKEEWRRALHPATTTGRASAFCSALAVSTRPWRACRSSTPATAKRNQSESSIHHASELVVGGKGEKGKAAYQGEHVGGDEEDNEERDEVDEPGAERGPGVVTCHGDAAGERGRRAAEAEEGKGVGRRVARAHL